MTVLRVTARDGSVSYVVAKKNGSPRNELAKVQMIQLRKEFGNKCFVCERGPEHHLEFAHLRPTGIFGRGRGRKERIADIRAHKDHYVLLCHRCHDKFDRMGLGPRGMQTPRFNLGVIKF
jgi:hypothetical protein